MEEEKDVYAILGLEVLADENKITRAYKKLALIHHPDRGGDKIKFHELKHARDFLLDPEKKKKYDKKIAQNVIARKKQQEREAEMDIKRKRMRDDLLRKESMHEILRNNQKRKKEVENIREKTKLRQEEMEKRIKQTKEDYKMKQDLVQRTVYIKWDKKTFSHSDDTLHTHFKSYGHIETIKLKASSAKIVFKTSAIAAQVVLYEGHNKQWKQVSLKGHVVDYHTNINTRDSDINMSESTDTKEFIYLPITPIPLEQHLVFEKYVLEKLRQVTTNSIN